MDDIRERHARNKFGECDHCATFEKGDGIYEASTWPCDTRIVLDALAECELARKLVGRALDAANARYKEVHRG